MNDEDVSQKERRYDRPLPVADGIYWIGSYQAHNRLLCNPYVIIENGCGVVIDGGDRPEFAVVMTKLLQTGLDPRDVHYLIYQHYDPDVCGALPNFIEMCASEQRRGEIDLTVFSHGSSRLFLHSYIDRSRHHFISTIDEHDYVLRVHGRTLRFIGTPYCHTADNFMTYDERTRTLFTSDLFGSFSRDWELFLQLDAACHTCTDTNRCCIDKVVCPVAGIVEFHRKIMPSNKALHHAMHILEQQDIAVIAPQHGSVLRQPEDIRFIIDLLKNLTGVGIDGIARADE
ncbi:MAG: MBL fold metallo-hydrolase [Magnetococcus sp. DMHC-8]